MDTTMMVAFFWSFLGFLAFIRTLIPPQFTQLLDDLKQSLLDRWSPYHEVFIHEESGAGTNDIHTYARLYTAKIRSSAQALVADCPRNSTSLTFTIAPNQRVLDTFRGSSIKWEYQTIKEQDGPFRTQERKSYKLTLAKSDKNIVPDYLAHVMKEGRELERLNTDRHLHTNMYDYWESVSFNPPATFETIAMEPDLKELVVSDLARFMQGKDFYSSVGRPWKRGYLLYGPPGTGKSSLIGAISNFTGYDVYDLELTKVRSNMELRQLLIHIKNRAIVVVEDIDCSIPIEKRKKNKKVETPDGQKAPPKENEDGVTLSGLLNFTDGLWSSCGSERIFIFTTNYVEKLDEALLRPGRMDMHIRMSYCTYTVFKCLAASYMKMKEDHRMFPEIEGLLSRVQITPAYVIEELLRYGQDVDKAMESLVKVLRDKEKQPSEQQREEEEDEDLSGNSSSSSEVSQ